MNTNGCTPTSAADVLKMIKQCNIRNYSIYLRTAGSRHYLFSYFEYTGVDFAADMAKMAADPTTQPLVGTLHPLPSPAGRSKRRGVVASMEEVFHTD